MKYGKFIAKVFLWAGAFFFVMSPAFGAALRAAPDRVEFGTIDEGINAVATIVIENTGSSQVEITRVQTS